MRWIARVAVLFTLCVAHRAHATGYLDDWHPHQTYWAVGWNVAVPVESLRSNWQTNPGWLGGGFDIRVGLIGRLALGASGTWNFFDQTYSSLTVEQPSYTFTGPVYRRLSSFTALATAHYYLTQSAVQPFIGVGIGGGWFTARQQIVDRDVTTYTSGLAVAPEVGFLFSVAPRLGLVLSARYQYNLTTFGAVRNPSWVSAQAGVAYCF
jgi:hypothetical protein